jgi:AcrR family transcriptional regulator
MPAKVDADKRRRQLVLVAAELIADEGINALTNQKIAERLAGSTTVVTHYFRSKRELLLHTYQTMASRARARVETAIRDSDDPLAACLHALLPLDNPSRVEWKVWLAYQGMSVGDPELTRIWASRATIAVDRLSRLIQEDVAAGRMPSHIDAEAEGGRLFALVQGMSFQSIVDPKHWPPEHLRQVIDNDLTQLRTAKRDRGTGQRRGIPGPANHRKTATTVTTAQSSGSGSHQPRRARTGTPE